MAGIEPASGREGPRTFYERSRLFCVRCRRPQPAKGDAYIGAAPLTCGSRQHPHGTPALGRPHLLRPGNGAGGRAPILGEPTPPFAAYAAKGRAETGVRTALLCAYARVLRGRAPRLAVRNPASPVEPMHPHLSRFAFHYTEARLKCNPLLLKGCRQIL